MSILNVSEKEQQLAHYLAEMTALLEATRKERDEFEHDAQTAEENDWQCRQACIKLTAERDALRELMNCYNFGGWTDSLALMQERDALRLAVQAGLDALERAAKITESYCGAWDDQGFALATEIRALKEVK